MAGHGIEQAETAETADGVGSGIPHHAVHGEDDEAVRHARDMTLAHHRILVRELTARNHLIQLLSGIDAFGFVATIGFTRGHVRLTHHQAKRLAIVPHRSVYIAHRGLAYGTQHSGTEHHAGLHGGVQLTGHIIGHGVSHHIITAQGHHGGGAALFRNHVLAVAVLHEQQQISEAQIGDDLPVGNEMVQPFAVVVVEIGARCENM